MGPIVVGVDGSPESGAAAAAGWLVARAAGVRCQLVHAVRDIRTSLDLAGSGIPVDALQAAMLARMRSEIALAMQYCVPSDVMNALIVRTGRAAAVLQAVTEELQGEMLVLGGKHHSALGRWLGGSTVQQTVRRLNVPLLVTLGDFRPRPRVLVALDPSDAAIPTAERATAFAQILGGALHAVHVVEPVPSLSGIPLPGPPPYAAWTRGHIERDVWPLLPIPDHHKVIRSGVAVETIAGEAAAWRADVIVVGSHGKRWVDRLLIGSVTEDLLNDLRASVLVVPVPAPERREVASLRLRTAATRAGVKLMCSFG